MNEDNHDNRVNEFQDQIESAIDRFIAEWNLTLTEAVGVLEIVKHDLMMRHTEGQEKE